MPAPLFYRRTREPAARARARASARAVGARADAAALILYHPLVLLALLGRGARRRRPARASGAAAARARCARAPIVALPIVLVNVLVSREGLTVFARLGDLGPFGQGDLTLEALVYGAVIALKVIVLILVTPLASLAVDPDELLRSSAGSRSARP